MSEMPKDCPVTSLCPVDRLQAQVAQKRATAKTALTNCGKCADKCLGDTSGCIYWSIINEATGEDYHNPADVQRIAKLTDMAKAVKAHVDYYVHVRAGGQTAGPTHIDGRFAEEMSRHIDAVFGGEED